MACPPTFAYLQGRGCPAAGYCRLFRHLAGGRPYYYNRTTNETTWELPSTRVATDDATAAWYALPVLYWDSCAQVADKQPCVAV